MEIPQSAIEKIKALPKPAVVGISGFGGSGKSTAANVLAGILRAPIVCIDQFSGDRTIEDYTHWKGMGWGRLEREILIPFLKGANPLTYGHWDHGANAIVKNVEVSHPGILIVEGVGLFRPEMLKYLDYRIWVDVPQEIAIARGKKRDREVHRNPQDEKWDGHWKRNDGEYFRDYDPRQKADLVLSNA